MNPERLQLQAARLTDVYAAGDDLGVVERRVRGQLGNGRLEAKGRPIGAVR